MPVKHTEEANLRPLDIQVGFVFGLEDVEDDADSVLVVVSDDSLVGVRCVGLYDSALLLAGFRWLVVFQLNRSRVQSHRILSEKQRLYFNELDVWIFWLFA